MRSTKYSALICCILVGSIVSGADIRSQERESRRPDLSGRWQLNRELRENAQEKLDRMQSSQGHGPGRHGLGGLFGRLFGGGDMEEARRLVLNAPSSFTLVTACAGAIARLRDLLQHGDAEGLANELNLDAQQTRQWFDEGFSQDGYGAEVTRALGTLVLTRILTTSRDRNEHAHG